MADRLKNGSYTSRVGFVLILYALLSAFCAFSITSLANIFRMQEDAVAGEVGVSQLILDLSATTHIGSQEIQQIAGSHAMQAVLLTEDDRIRLPEHIQEYLRDHSIVTSYQGFGSSPVTYVRLPDQLVSITSLNSSNLFVSSFTRMFLFALTGAAVFLVFALPGARKISHPITELTEATRRIRTGDFSVRIPETDEGEVGELMHSFNEMTASLGRISYLQKDFIASVSHEFRTPIASIRGFTQILSMPSATEEQKQEAIAMIISETDRLSRLSDTMLRLSALEQQEKTTQIVPFRVDEQIRQLILQMESAWSARRIQWDLHLDPITIPSDPDLLAQVWSNLIQNAIKFSHDDGIILIQIQEGNPFRFSIQDHGIGMSEETIRHIYDRFYQADQSRSKGGVGLGLSLVHRIVVILGGTIEVSSQEGQGTTFTVSIPITEEKP